MTRSPVEGLYCVIDTAWAQPAASGSLASALVASGAGIIQLRAKGSPGDEMLAAARAVREATRGRALFIVNDRLDIAVLSGADGAHLGQDDIPLPEARRLMPGAVIGISTHNLDEALKAQGDGADYVSFGPIFATKTKKDADVPKGLDGLRAFTAQVGLPVVAIGGITAETAAPAIEAGASSVAVISDILLAKDPGARATLIISRLRALRPPSSR